MSPTFKVKAAYVSATLAAVLTAHDGIAATVESSYSYVPQRIVKFADLDVTRAAGAVALYARITHAAQDVCETPVSSRIQWLRKAVNECQRQAIEQAVTDVNAPALTSYHLTRAK